MPGGFEADDVLWTALSECENHEEMRAVLEAWVELKVFDLRRVEPPWLKHHNTRRRHTALGGLPPGSRLSPT